VATPRLHAAAAGRERIIMWALERDVDEKEQKRERK
jgi:hypothetical protein